jgi:cyclic beta-1,2-glucan synthetase
LPQRLLLLALLATLGLCHTKIIAFEIKCHVVIPEFYLHSRPGSGNLQVRLSGTEAWCRTAGRFPVCTYLGGIALITALVAGSLLALALATGTPDWLLVPTAVLALLAATHLGVALTNWLATLLVAPHPLPRMDFSEGIPAQARTLVVVPTMLTSTSGVEDLVEALEVRWLANRDQQLYFGLLTDFRDAPAWNRFPETGRCWHLAQTRIETSSTRNMVSGPESWQPEQYLLSLPPPADQWNPQEQIWMGYERKRGKLADLNALLRGDARRWRLWPALLAHCW